MTDDTDTPDKGHFEINLAAQYTRFMGGSAANVPSLEVNYGVLRTCRRRSWCRWVCRRSAASVRMSASATSSFSLKYRFIEEDSWGWRPAVAIAPQINLPTAARRGVLAPAVSRLHPFWAQRTLSVDGVRRRRPQHKHRPDQKNWWFWALACLRELDPNWTVGGELYYSSPEATGQNTYGIQSRFDLYHQRHVPGPVLGRPEPINARDTNQFSTYIGMQFTF